MCISNESCIAPAIERGGDSHRTPLGQGNPAGVNTAEFPCDTRGTPLGQGNPAGVWEAEFL